MARSADNGAAEVVRVSDLSAKRIEREKQREEEIRGEEEELGEGGLLLHATTARQGVDERVEGDPGNGARSLEQDDRDAFAGNPLHFSFSFYSSPFLICFSVF